MNAAQRAIRAAVRLVFVACLVLACLGPQVWPQEALALKVVPGTVSEGQTAQGSINRNKAVESDELGAIAKGKADGVYYGSGEGFKSEITVAVTVKDEQVTAIEIVSQADDQSYFTHAEGVEEKVVEYQRVSVNAMAGATYSSKGILAAVENALGPDAHIPVTAQAWFKYGIVGLTGAFVLLAGFCAVKGRKATAPKRRLAWLARQRLATQLAFFIVAPSVFASALAGIKYFFQTIYEADMDGIAPVFEVTSLVVVLIALLAFTVAFGRFFCGFACSFGLFEDVLWRAREAVRVRLHLKSRVKKEPGRAARGLEHGLRALKYVVLVVVMYIIWMGYTDALSEASPWVAFAQLASLSTRRLTVLGCVLLGLVAIGSLWRERFFCRYLCPMGAVFSVLPTLPWAHMRRTPDRCLPKCTRCHQVCPMGTSPEGHVLAGGCVACGACVAGCPAGSAHWGLAGKAGATVPEDGGAELAEKLGAAVDAKLSCEGDAPRKTPGSENGRRDPRRAWPVVALVLAVVLMGVLWAVGATQYLPVAPWI